MHPDGRVQRLRPAIGRQGETRPEWSVIAELARRCDLDLEVSTGRWPPSSSSTPSPSTPGSRSRRSAVAACAGRSARPSRRSPRRPRARRDAAPSANGAVPADAAGTSMWDAPEVEVSPSLKFLYRRQEQSADATAEPAQAAAAGGSAEHARGRRLLRSLVDPDPQGDHHLRRRPAARADRADRRAQAARALPGPLRAQPRRPLRRAAAARRHPQAAHQGAVPPDDLGRLPVRARADDLDPDRGRGLRDHPLRRRPAHLRHAGRPLRDRRLDRPALPVRVRGGRLLRDHARRLVLGLEVLVPRRDARRRAADLLRGLPGTRARRRDLHRRHALADRHRPGPGRHVVHRPAVLRLPDLPRRRASRRPTAPRST